MGKRILTVLIVLAIASSALAGKGGIWLAADRIADEYIVVLADQQTRNVEPIAAQLSRAYEGEMLLALNHGVRAFGVRIKNRQAAEALARSPLVDHVEENGKVFFSYTTQDFGADTSWWPLDRIDNTGALYWYHAYAYTSTGTSSPGSSGTNVYVVGTGVLGTHEQFGGRVTAGMTFGDGLPANNPCGGFPQPPPPTDPPTIPAYGAGHETGVASVIGGITSGVAKAVTIIPVKVANCDPTSGQIAQSTILWWLYGTSWIIQDHTSFPNYNKRAVVNFSGGWSVPGLGASQCGDVTCVSAAEANISNLVGLNIVVVAAANNFNNANCDTLPAKMGYGSTDPRYINHVITVGGSTEGDQRWVRLPGENIPGNLSDTGSNYGQCVDIYAPAQHFYHLADIASNSSYRQRIDQLSGTSFSAPIVTGIAARLLQTYYWMTPQQVWFYIRDHATHPSCFDWADPQHQTCRNDRLAYISPYD